MCMSDNQGKSCFNLCVCFSSCIYSKVLSRRVWRLFYFIWYESIMQHCSFCSTDIFTVFSSSRKAHKSYVRGEEHYSARLTSFFFVLFTSALVEFKPTVNVFSSYSPQLCFVPLASRWSSKLLSQQLQCSRHPASVHGVQIQSVPRCGPLQQRRWR